MKGKSKIIALALAAFMALTLISGCASSTPTPSANTSPTQGTSPASSPTDDATPEPLITLTSIFPGDEPKGFENNLAVLNEKLAEDISVNLKLTWATWDEYYNKVQMGVAAGEDIDWFWDGSSNVSVHTASKIIAPINEYMEKYGEPIYANINPDLFSSMTIDGNLMGLPSTGNSPIYNVYNCLLYREDLRLKYSLPKLDTIDNLELYFETIKQNEPTMIPFCNNNASYTIMFEFGPEGFFSGTNGAVAFRVNSDKSVDFMPIQDAPSYIGAVKKAREWYLKGYIPSDILNISDTSAKMNSGAAAASGGSALTAAEQQPALVANVPGGLFADQPYFGTSKKYLRGNGGNAAYLTPTSKNPDKVVQFWAWIFTYQENYDLYCYGVEGVDYTLENNRISYLDTGYSAFPGWMFKNMNYLRFNEYMSNEYIETIKNWDEGAEISPLQGFTFNPENVSTELATFNTVYQSYSLALSSGSIDYDEAYAEINERYKAAGQDKILEEVRIQAEAFLNR